MIRTRTLFFLLLMSLFASAGAQTYTLRYTFDPQVTLKYKRTEKTKAFSQSQTGRSVDLDRQTESYITIAPEEAGPGLVAFRFIQDTAIVTNFSAKSGGFDPGIDFPNLLTKKPIKVEMSASGAVKGVQPLAPLDIAQRLPAGASETMFVRRAAIFPQLPERELRVGLTWNTMQRDTLHPVQNLPDVGQGKGLRLLLNDVTYSVTGTEKIDGRECMKLGWEAKSAVEGKMIFNGQEVFNEAESTTTGTLYFDIASGILVKSVTKTEENSTTAVFAKMSDIIPTTSTSEITLQILTH